MIAELLEKSALIAVILLFLTGKIIPGFVWSRGVKEAEELRRELKEVNKIMQDSVIPALIEYNNILKDFHNELDKAQDN